MNLSQIYNCVKLSRYVYNSGDQLFLGETKQHIYPFANLIFSSFPQSTDGEDNKLNILFRIVQTSRDSVHVVFRGVNSFKEFVFFLLCNKNQDFAEKIHDRLAEILVAQLVSLAKKYDRIVVTGHSFGTFYTFLTAYIVNSHPICLQHNLSRKMIFVEISPAPYYKYKDSATVLRHNNNNVCHVVNENDFYCFVPQFSSHNNSVIDTPYRGAVLLIKRKPIRSVMENRSSGYVEDIVLMTTKQSKKLWYGQNKKNIETQSDYDLCRGMFNHKIYKYNDLFLDFFLKNEIDLQAMRGKLC